MKILYDLILKLERCIAPEITKNNLSELVLQIDERMELILRELKYREDNTLADCMQKSLNQQMESTLRIQESTNGDCARVPYSVNAVCTWLQQKVNSELMLFTTDFKFDGILKFKISTSSFGKLRIGTSKPVQEKDNIIRKITELQQKGYVITGKDFSWELSDCDRNRSLIQNFSKEVLGASVFTFQSRKGKLTEISCYLRLEECHLQRKTPTVNDDNNSDILSEDEAVALKKNLSLFKYAIADYSQMCQDGMGDVILANCESYMYEIEDKLMVHGNIWKRKAAQCTPIRERNQKIHASIEEMDIESFFQLSEMYSDTPECRKTRLQAAWDTIRYEIESMGEKLGLYLSECYISSYHNATLVFLNNTISCENPEGLDCFYDERNSQYLIYPTDKNIDKIDTIFKERYPNIVMEDYSVKCRDKKYISKIQFTLTVPADFL